jgi:hypothetical protein
MSDAPPTPQKEHTFRRPLLMLGALVLALLGVLTFLYLRDDAPADDSDFLVAWHDGNALTNPLVEFVMEIQPKNLDQQHLEIWEQNAAITKELRAEKTSVLTAFHKLMATDPASWNLLDVRGTVWEGTNISVLFPVGSDVLPKNIEDHVHKGEHQEAVALALEMHQFAHQLHKAEGGLYFYRTTMDLQDRAGGLLLQALEGSTSPDLLKQAQEQLSGRDPTPQDLILALRDEHTANKDYLLKSVNETAIFEMVFRDEDPNFIKRWYRPHRTIGHHLELCRQMVAGLEHGWAGAQAKADAWTGSTKKRSDGKWARYANPNFVGDRVLLQIAPSKIARDTAIHISMQRMLITSLAVRRSELVHHKTPRTLEELVPAFLSAVPVDAMSHTSLEWDPTTRTLNTACHWRPDLSRDPRPSELLDEFPRLGGKVILGKDNRLHFQLGPESNGQTGNPGMTPSAN